MPYVPSKKTDGKSTDRELINVQVERLSNFIVGLIKENSDFCRIYKEVFHKICELANNQDKNNISITGQFVKTILEVGEKYGYEGAFLGELNYAVTRVIQRVPQLIAEQEKCGLVKGKELRYWLYAMTVSALTATAQRFSHSIIGVDGVFEDIKDEYKVRVNKSYEIAQILKSGDCYDTPYFNKVVEIINEEEKVVGHTYIELINDGKNVNLDKMPYKLIVKNIETEEIKNQSNEKYL